MMLMRSQTTYCLLQLNAQYKMCAATVLVLQWLKMLVAQLQVQPRVLRTIKDELSVLCLSPYVSGV